MRVFDFNSAIARMPGKSVIDGLRDDRSAAPDYQKLSAEHRAYVAALRQAGMTVDVLAPLEAFPDSVYVEDPALVFGQGAIMLRPGAPSRLGEVADMRSQLARHFTSILELTGEEYADGGDILVTPQIVFIGLSGRTSGAGARALSAKLAQFGMKARIVRTPSSILHFKTASALLAEDTIIATRALADSGIFKGFDVAVVPQGEEAAANLIRVNDIVFVGDAYPRTAELIASRGHVVHALTVSETAKLNAGLSCMSLRWWKP
jgi:dimethylargininase